MSFLVKVMFTADNEESRERLLQHYWWGSVTDTTSIGLRLYSKHLDVNYNNHIERLKFNVWSISNNHPFSSNPYTVKTYCKGAHAHLYLVDLSNPDFEKSKYWVGEVLKNNGIKRPIPTIFLGDHANIISNQKLNTSERKVYQLINECVAKHESDLFYYQRINTKKDISGLEKAFDTIGKEFLKYIDEVIKTSQRNPPPERTTPRLEEIVSSANQRIEIEKEIEKPSKVSLKDVRELIPTLIREYQSIEGILAHYQEDLDKESKTKLKIFMNLFDGFYQKIIKITETQHGLLMESSQREKRILKKVYESTKMVKSLLEEPQNIGAGSFIIKEFIDNLSWLE